MRRRIQELGEEITHEEIKAAMDEFFQHGGHIQRLPPQRVLVPHPIGGDDFLFEEDPLHPEDIYAL